jgi:hypothetical protein
MSGRDSAVGRLRLNQLNVISLQSSFVAIAKRLFGLGKGFSGSWLGCP